MIRILAFVLLGFLLGPGVATAQPRVLEVDISDLDDDQLDFLSGWDRGNERILDVSGLGVTRYRLDAPKRFRRPARSEPLGMSRETGARPRVRLRPPDPRVRIPRLNRLWEN